MDCDILLTDEQALIFLRVSACDRYKMLLSNREFMKPTWIYCKSCAHMVYSPESIKRDTVVCDCGEFLCTHCKEQLHKPLTCDEAKLYASMMQMNGNYFGINKVNLKGNRADIVFICHSRLFFFFF